MTGESLPTEVKHFILSHLASVEELEILLLLANGEQQEWTADAIYQVILSSRSSVERAVEKFVVSGFVRKSDAIPPLYRYQFQGDNSAVTELSRCYRRSPVRVIEAIYQKNRGSVQGFADAFRFKRDDP